MSLLDTRGGNGRGIESGDITDSSSTSRTLVESRQPIQPRSVGSTDTQSEPEIVVTPRYLAPVREPLQPRDTVYPRSTDTTPTIPNLGIDPNTPFGTAFTDFLGGGSGGFDQQPVRVIPTQSASGGNNNLLLLLALIGAAGAIYYFYEKHKRKES